MAFLWAPPVHPSLASPGRDDCSSSPFSSPQRKGKGDRHLRANHLHEQVNFLVQAAVACSLSSPALSRTLYRDARQISLKHSLRLSSDLKWGACKNCHTLYLPGVSSQVRIESLASVCSALRKKNLKRLPEKEVREAHRGCSSPDDIREASSQENDGLPDRVGEESSAQMEATGPVTEEQEIAKNTSLPEDTSGAGFGTAANSLALGTRRRLRRWEGRRRCRRGRQYRRVEKRAAREQSCQQEEADERQSDSAPASTVSDEPSVKLLTKAEGHCAVTAGASCHGADIQGVFENMAETLDGLPFQDGIQGKTQHHNTGKKDLRDSDARHSGSKRPLAETVSFLAVTCLVCGTTRRRGCNKKLELQDDDAVR